MMNINQAILIRIYVMFGVFIFTFISCNSEDYIPEHNNQFAAYFVIENNLPIEIQIFQTTQIGDLPNQDILTDKKEEIAGKLLNVVILLAEHIINCK